MIIDDFFRRVDALKNDLLRERAGVENCAELIAAALRRGNAVFCAELGHGLQGDFLNRAGGLGAVRHFSWSFTQNNAVPEALAKRPSESRANPDILQAELALEAGNVRRGDVMLVGSVSGKTMKALALADGCRKRGVTVIAFISREYSSQVDSPYPTGEKLTEIADFVLDLQVPYGDAAVAIPGYDHDLIPFSGISTLLLGWMLWGRVMELMGADAEKPVTYRSVNRAGGREAYDAMQKELNRKGY